MTIDPRYAAVATLIEHVVRRWPDHAPYVAKSFAGRDPAAMAVSDQLSQCILKLAEHLEGGIEALCDDYRFLCEEIVLPEEIHFRRHGRYRLASFADAEREVYANAPFMTRYMNGLLLSDVLWTNHAAAFASFQNDYLPRVVDGAHHLEVGPGHGLFLHFAARSPWIASITGWDISAASIAGTRDALELLGAPLAADLRLQDLYEAPDDTLRFDSVAMSEILEHLEDPIAALKAVARHMKPGALLFVNVPANSPAPDHIYLFQGVEHARDVVRDAGFAVELEREFAMTGATLERARRKRLTTSCVVIARK